MAQWRPDLSPNAVGNYLVAGSDAAWEMSASANVMGSVRKASKPLSRRKTTSPTGLMLNIWSAVICALPPARLIESWTCAATETINSRGTW